MGGEEVSFRVDHDRSMDVLMAHCRDMKRQECYLRMATAFLLMGCALFIFCVNLRHVRTANFAQTHLYEPETDVPQQLTGTIPERPSAHLIAAHSVTEPEVSYVSWDHDGDALHIQGFRYEEGALVVPKNGYYHVYLQMTYRKPESYNCKDNTLPLYPTVEWWRDSYQAYIPLMSAFGTLSCSDVSQRSIYTAGIYYLEKGSKLKVTYGAEKDLTVQNKMFFGAYLI